jgi:hypothetical protein
LPWALLLALLIGLPVLVLAAAALLVPGKRTGLARALWVAAIIILGVGWLAGHVASGANAQSLVSPFTGPAVSAAGFALLCAAVAGADSLLDFSDRGASAPAARRIFLKSVSILATALLLAGPLAGLTTWAAQNLLQPADGAAPTAAGSHPLGTPLLIGPTSARTLPATAIDRGEGPEQTRTLLIGTGENGTYDAALMRGAGTTLDGLSTIAAARNIMGDPGKETVRADDAATAELRSAVATVVAGQGVDPRPELERMGAGFVVLRASDTAAQLTASRMDAVPGLVAVGRTDVGWLWRVSPLNQPAIKASDIAHRVRIVDGGGAAIGLVPSGLESVDAAVPDGPEGRLVVLAERADPGWAAWLDGRRLTSTTSGWGQAFTLPVQGGRLTVKYENPWAMWAGIAQAVVIGLTTLLAIPMPSRRPNTGLSRDEGSLRKEYQHA